MKKETILNTYNQFLRFKTTRFSEYSLTPVENGIAYIEGKGDMIKETIIIEDYDDLLSDLLQFEKYFEDKTLLSKLKKFKHNFDMAEYFFRKDGSNESFSQNYVFLFEKLIKQFSEDLFPVSNQQKESEKERRTFVDELISFFDKYGLAETDIENALDNSVNLLLMIFKFADLFSFIENIYEMEDNFKEIEITLSKAGLKEKKFTEEEIEEYRYKHKEDPTKFEIVNYFDCPFEYAKYIMLISIIVKEQRIIRCENCKSIIISRRKDQKYCNNICRAIASRNRKNLLK